MANANDHPNAARAREYLDAFASGDSAAVTSFFDDGIVWRVGGNHPLSGTYEGRDAVEGYLARAREETGGTLRLEPESVLASDRHLAMFLRVTGRREDRQLDARLTQVVKLTERGSWGEYWALSGDQADIDEFWS